MQIGTANYMAPEIWARRCQTVKADMFSLGVSVYELCMLRHLFSGATEDEVQRRIEGFTAADAAAAAAALLPRYSQELAGLLESMLQVGRVRGVWSALRLRRARQSPGRRAASQPQPSTVCWVCPCKPASQPCSRLTTAAGPRPAALSSRGA